MIISPYELACICFFILCLHGYSIDWKAGSICFLSFLAVGEAPAEQKKAEVSLEVAVFSLVVLSIFPFNKLFFLGLLTTPLSMLLTRPFLPSSQMEHQYSCYGEEAHGKCTCHIKSLEICARRDFCCLCDLIPIGKKSQCKLFGSFKAYRFHKDKATMLFLSITQQWNPIFHGKT